MAPEPGTRRRAGVFPPAPACLLATALACALTAPAAHALRLVNYNVMLYPSVNVSGRNPYFRTVMQPLGADVFVVQEINNPSGIDSIRNNVLNVLEPGQWASAPYTNGPDSNNGLFYKPSKVTLLGSWAWLPPDNLRYVNVYRLKPVGYTTIPEFRIYSLHLKAGNTSTDENRRLTDAIAIRDSMNNAPPGTHIILTGDFNAYKSSDLAVQKFLENQGDNDGRVYDPLNLVGTWQDNLSFAPYHTQCPSTSAYRPSGSYSGGGVDDRFDLFLPTYNLNDGEGMDLLTPTYIAVGNDGQHLNKAVTEAPIAASDTVYARALWWASDHLPIRVDLQLPAKISTAPALAFGTVIVGGPATQNLSVTNPATLPADELNYSFTPPAGFGAPAGSFALNAGAPAALHAISMSTASAGNLAGNLSVASDDPDAPTTLVALAGTVLDHAQASLDSSALSLSDTLDFGDHEGGAFGTLLARVHNVGYDPLHARLAVSAGAITGGAGRFSLVGGFTPALVAGVGQGYTLDFDDNGATQDSTYHATLTFTSADEALPGAAAQPDLVVTLRARRVSGTTAVGDRFLPGETRLLAPFPNPVTRASTLAFDLARAAHVRLEVFDLHGRRVAMVADRTFDPGRHRLDWDARGTGGNALGAGLYFVRLSGPGLRTQSARLAIVR